MNNFNFLKDIKPSSKYLITNYSSLDLSILDGIKKDPEWTENLLKIITKHLNRKPLASEILLLLEEERKTKSDLLYPMLVCLKDERSAFICNEIRKSRMVYCILNIYSLEMLYSYLCNEENILQ